MIDRDLYARFLSYKRKRMAHDHGHPVTSWCPKCTDEVRPLAQLCASEHQDEWYQVGPYETFRGRLAASGRIEWREVQVVDWTCRRCRRRWEWEVPGTAVLVAGS